MSEAQPSVSEEPPKSRFGFCKEDLLAVSHLSVRDAAKALGVSTYRLSDLRLKHQAPPVNVSLFGSQLRLQSSASLASQRGVASCELHC